MISFIKNNLLGSEFVGLEIFTDTSNQLKIAICYFKKTKNEITIEKTTIDSFNDITISKLNKKSPHILIVNTKDILQREVNSLEEKVNKELAFQKIFPNLKTSDFYLDSLSFKTKENIYICRKNYIDELISLFKKNAIQIVNVNLGNSTLKNISSFLDEKKHISTNIHLIHFQDELIQTKNQEVRHSFYKIKDLEVSNENILAFSGILEFISKKNFQTTSLQKYSNNLLDTFLQKSFYNKFLKTYVFTLFFLLLINFLIYNHYYSKIQSLEISNNETVITKEIQKLEKSINKSEYLLNKVDSFQNLTTSSILAKIAKGVPKTIEFTKVEYNPLMGDINDNEAIQTQKNLILVSGITNNSTDFNNWLKSLKKNAFVTSILIANYGKDENSKTIFTLKISYKNA